jgi:RecA-family ATPase
LAIHDVSVYIQQEVPRPPFYIDELLPQEGSMLIYGDPKVKKSWLVESMGYAIATGTEWLGFHTNQARFLLNQFEISSYAYHNRLRLMGRHFTVEPNMFFENTHTLMYLDDDRTFNTFMAEIRESGVTPQIVAMDCLSACFGGDENDGEQMASFIQRMSTIKDEFHCSIIIVHHANKNQLNPSTVSRARGHSRLTGWVDTLLYMAEQPTGVQLQFKARQAANELHSVNIQFENHLWRVRN